jgi:DNA repair protein RecO
VDYKTEAIILSSRDVNEFDRIYDIFSCDFGKTSVLAKGVRKPTAKLASGLEPLTHSEIFLVKGRSLDRVTGVIIHDQYTEIKKDIDRIKFIKPIFLMFKNSFLEINSQQKEIFDLIKNFLEKTTFNEIDWVKMRLMRVFLIWRIMFIFGNQPELFYCSKCQRKFSVKDYTFWFCSSLEIFCDLCGNNINNINEKKIKINQSVIKLFRFINQKDWSVVGKVLIQEKDLRDIEKITQLALEGILDSKVF